MKSKNFDFEAQKELNLTMENEGDIYAKEGMLAKNYARKWKKGQFDFAKAHKGVKNLIVTPFARDYQNKWGTKVPDDVRDAVAKSRVRAIMRRIKEGEF
jgi:hypothetical protein